MVYENYEQTDETEAEWNAAVANERAYQIAKGYTLEHDRAHGLEHLLVEARLYAERGRQVQSAALIDAALELLANPRQSNMVDHARRELEFIGADPIETQHTLNVVQAFADAGHSGGSAAYAIPMITRLLRWESLSPLTNRAEEWNFIGEDVWGAKGGVWQNRRNPAAFSHDGGRTYWLTTDGSNQRKQKKIYKTEKSRGLFGWFR